MIDFSNIEGYYGPLQVEDLDVAVAMALNPDSAPDATHTSNLITSAAVAGVRSDIASINIAGAINDTGATIPQGTFFYISGTLVKAKTDIADGATLTDGTNYEAVTAGGLNAVKLPNNAVVPQRIGSIASNKTSATITFPISTHHVMWFAAANANKLAEILVSTDSLRNVYLLEVAKGANISFTANNDLTVTVNLTAAGNTIPVVDMPITGSAYPTIS